MQTLELAKKVCDENGKKQIKLKMTGASHKLIRAQWRSERKRRKGGPLCCWRY